LQWREDRMQGICRKLLNFIWNYDINWIHHFLSRGNVIADLDGQVVRLTSE
jgi:hypothetical protein